jgi:hypothetical protein
MKQTYLSLVCLCTLLEISQAQHIATNEELTAQAMAELSISGQAEALGETDTKDTGPHQNKSWGQFAIAAACIFGLVCFAFTVYR